MSSRKTRPLGEIARVINGRAYKQDELLESGKYRVLRVGNFFSNGSWYFSDLELDSDKYCESGDLLFAWSASFGPRIWNEDKVIYHYHIWKIVEDQEVVDRRFLYYFLMNSVKGMMASTHGSIMLHLTKEFMERLPIHLPGNTTIQRNIAAVLSAIDAKIDCNNRINAELETIAKALYDYWFVQFDFPDANGKPYKSSGGKMVYNKVLKREIPEAWKDGTAKGLLTFNPSLPLTINSEASYIDMASLPVTGFMTEAPERKPYAGGMKFQNGDVVVARITPCLENGKTALISLLENSEIGFGSTEFIVLRGKKLSLSAFAAQLSRSEPFRQFAISNMTGTSGRKRIDAKTLETFSLPIPPDELLSSYEKIADPSLKRMTNNTKENQQLSQLRDWLLPMLMNGQVTVHS